VHRTTRTQIGTNKQLARSYYPFTCPGYRLSFSKFDSMISKGPHITCEPRLNRDAQSSQLLHNLKFDRRFEMAVIRELHFDVPHIAGFERVEVIGRNRQ
jgi:hypothetical protein